MKKFISILLALMLVMSLGTVAFADGTATTPTDATSATISKTYKLIGAGSSPAETFTLVQVGDGVVSESDATVAPALGEIVGAAFAAGEATTAGVTHQITVNLPSYEKVGVYTYTLKEVDNRTAGVHYFDGNITLVVTVVNGNDGTLRIAGVHTESPVDSNNQKGQKSNTFENTYSAGSLSVSKTVSGNLGDKTKRFKFTVTLTGEEGKTYADSFAVTGAVNATASFGENTFYLKDGDTITIENLPYGVTYTVAEDAEDYTSSNPNGISGEIAADTQTAAFTNTKEGTVDTGISLDSLPYILMLVVVGAAIVVVSTRKKGEQF